MKSSVEALEGNKVKVYVEIEEAEFERDIDKAFKLLAKEVNLPGFRAGKAPRKVLEARIGLGPAREQALSDALPTYLSQALREHDVDVIAQPEVEITDGRESGPVEFDATCEVRPEIEIEGYDTLSVEVGSIDVSDEELEAARNEELSKHGVLETVDRASEPGDFLTIDMVCLRDGEEVPGLNTEDWSYEVGQGWVTEDFDEHVTGVSAGDTVSFTSTPKGTEEPADFELTIAEVQSRTLPELTDDWVSENLAEFDTVDAWNASLRDRLEESKLQTVRQRAGALVNEGLAGLVELDPPKPMVDAELQQHVQNTVQQLQGAGIDVNQWLQMTGQEPEDFIESMRPQAEIGVKVDLALRAVAKSEGLEVEPHELDARYAQLAMQYGQKAKDIRKIYEDNDGVSSLVAQIRLGKAFDWVIHRVTFLDDDGNPIDRDRVLGHTHDHDVDDADHADHDHDSDAEAGAADPESADSATATEAGETEGDES